MSNKELQKWLNKNRRDIHKQVVNSIMGDLSYKIRGFNIWKKNGVKNTKRITKIMEEVLLKPYNKKLITSATPCVDTMTDSLIKASLMFDIKNDTHTTILEFTITK